jgi:GGDEF domain-containing protein
MTSIGTRPAAQWCKCLTRVARRADLLASTGGEEFPLVLPQTDETVELMAAE